jgi:hypothetical protein
MQSEVGNGASTLFWSDRWIAGQRVADIAPRLGVDIEPAQLVMARLVIARYCNEPARLGLLY